jgi:hypothetical protein
MTQLIWFIPPNEAKPSNSGWVDFTRTRANQGTVDDALNEIIEDYRNAIQDGYTVRYVRVPEHALSAEQFRFLKTQIPIELWQSCHYNF